MITSLSWAVGWKGRWETLTQLNLSAFPSPRRPVSSQEGPSSFWYSGDMYLWSSPCALSMHIPLK